MLYARIPLFYHNKVTYMSFTGDLGKHGGSSTSIDTHPLWLAYYRSQPYTLFSEIPESVSPPHPTLSSSSSDSLTTATTTLAPSPGSTPEAYSPPSSSAVASPQRAPAAVAGVKRVRSRMDDDYVYTTTTSNEHILCDPTDIDPNYVPVRKRRTASEWSNITNSLPSYVLIDHF